MTLSTGHILQNRYRIISSLGQGGMGAVYRARDERLNIDVALKEMTPQPGLDAGVLAQLRQQFQQEANVLARLDHPNLVDVTDSFQEGGNAYLVMKLVAGESLHERIERQGGLPEPEVLAWADQLLDALAYCHGRGVIHRDIKPQNVIIRPDGRAVLVDFGLVKLWDPDDPHTKTAMRGMGTPEYAPPEQYDAQSGHTDPRSDIYGLGATLYHALTGQAPVSAGNRMAALHPFPGVRDLNPQVSAAVSAAVLRAMDLPVPSRFQSAAEMQAALSAPAAAPVSPPSPVRHQPAPPRQATKAMPGAPAAAHPWWKRVPGWVWVVGGVGSAGLLMLCGLVVLAGVIIRLPVGAPAPTHRPTSTPAPRLTSAPTPSPIPVFAPTAKPAATVGAEPMVVAQAGGTNLRSGPGTNFPVVGRLEANEAAGITGRYGDWWQVDYGGTIAWVANWVVAASNADRVPEVAPPSSPIPPTPVPPTAGPVRTPLVTATPRPRGSVVYVVQAGDTLFGIALRYGVDPDQIRQLNGLQDDRIYVGQVLVISVLDRPTPAR